MKRPNQQRAVVVQRAILDHTRSPLGTVITIAEQEDCPVDAVRGRGRR